MAVVQASGQPTENVETPSVMGKAISNIEQIFASYSHKVIVFVFIAEEATEKDKLLAEDVARSLMATFVTRVAAFVVPSKLKVGFIASFETIRKLPAFTMLRNSLSAPLNTETAKMEVHQEELAGARNKKEWLARIEPRVKMALQPFAFEDDLEMKLEARQLLSQVGSDGVYSRSVMCG